MKNSLWGKSPGHGGKSSRGKVSEGILPEGKVPDGKVPDGKVPEGKVPDRNDQSEYWLNGILKGLVS